MTPFDEDWHALSLSRGLLELLRLAAAPRLRDRDFQRLEKLAAEAAERVDTAVHQPTPGRYRAALRKADACAAHLARSHLPADVKEPAGRALRLSRALLEHLAAGRRAPPGVH